MKHVNPALHPVRKCWWLATLVVSLLWSIGTAEAQVETLDFSVVLPASVGTNPDTDTTFDSADYRGKVIWVDFWASWCAPCRKSFPWLAEMQERYGDQGLVVLAVNLDQKPADRQRFLDEVPAGFLVGSDPQGQLAEQFQVQGMPSVRVIGHQGDLIAEHVGFRLKETNRYETAIEKALEMR